MQWIHPSQSFFLHQSQIGFIRCHVQSKMEAKVLDMCMGESLFKKMETSKKKSKNLNQYQAIIHSSTKTM